MLLTRAPSHRVLYQDGGITDYRRPAGLSRLAVSFFPLRGTEMAIKDDYLRFKRDDDRLRDELEEGHRAEAAAEAAALAAAARVREQQFDKELDELCPDIMKFARDAGMLGLHAVAWAFDWVRAGKQLARQPRRVF
jgi:hypothetical protein